MFCQSSTACCVTRLQYTVAEAKSDGSCSATAVGACSDNEHPEVKAVITPDTLSRPDKACCRVKAMLAAASEVSLIVSCACEAARR